MMGNAGSISLAYFATSHPSILPRPRSMSVTSARHLLLLPFSKVTASSPEDAIAGSKPPSVRAASTMLRIDWSSSTTRTTSKSSNTRLPNYPAQKNHAPLSLQGLQRGFHHYQRSGTLFASHKLEET